MNRKDIFRLIGISLVAASILTSCYFAATPVAHVIATANPGSTIVPTVLPTMTSTMPPTVQPTTTSTVAEIPTLTTQLAPQLIPTLNAFCRIGPGTAYYQITFLQKGMVYTVIGRNSLNTWWKIQVPGTNGCWVGDANVSKQVRWIKL